MLTSTKKQLLPYAMVTLFGLIGFTLPLPMLPKMFLDPEYSVLPDTYSLTLRNFFLGLVMMSFPLGQILGSPLLGRLSDRFGRKRAIILSLCGNFLGYLLTGISILLASVPGIFFGLFICGFCEGNIAISQSVVADITQHESINKRIVLFGWIEMFICIGAVIGPLLGGLLSDNRYGNEFSFATPFWAAAFIVLMGVILIAFWSKETKSFEKKIHSQAPLSFWKLLFHSKLKIFYLANFFYALALFGFYRFAPVFLDVRFNLEPAFIGYALSYEAFINGMTQIWIVKKLSDRFSPKALTALFSALLGLFLILFVLPSSPWAIIATIFLLGIGFGVATTNGSVLISENIGPQMQGHALGTLIAVHMAGAMLIAFVGGMLAAINSYLPLFTSALMALICALILGLHFKQSTRKNRRNRSIDVQ